MSETKNFISLTFINHNIFVVSNKCINFAVEKLNNGKGETLKYCLQDN